jgi:hypothetical protein
MSRATGSPDGGAVRVAGELISPLQRSPMARELTFYEVRQPLMRDIESAALTLGERLRVYPALWLIPVYVGATALLALLAGQEGWADDRLSPLALAALFIAYAGVLHVLVAAMTVEGDRPEGRRAQVVLARSLRAGRRTWAAPDGDRVRVYTLSAPRRAARWPGGLLYRITVESGREFRAEEDASEAHEYVAELEAACEGDAAAPALARALNAPTGRKA